MNSVSGMTWSWWWDTAYTNESGLLNTTILLFFTLLVIFWIANKLAKTPFPLPPGPRGLPIVGYLPFLGTDLHIKFTQLANLYGPIYKFWLGNSLCVVVNSPEVVEEVIRDQDAIFANRDPPIAALICTYGNNDIGFTSYGPEWRKLRKIFVREMLSSTSLDACYGLRKQEVKRTITELFGKIGTPVNFGVVALMTMTNAVMSMVGGGRIQGYASGDELQDMMGQIMVLLGMTNISDVFPSLARFDLQGVERKTRTVSDWFDGLFNYAIEQTRQRRNAIGGLEKGEGENEEGRNFLQYLLELKESKDSSSSITLTQLKGMLMDIVVGGTDTSSATVVWTMTELLRHPEVMRKVSEELTKVVGLNAVVEESHVHKLHYLEAVVKETLRLHPTLPFLVPHVPSQTTKVSGYTIPKGTKIFLNAWAIHRDPKLWDSPLEFRPKRFLNGEIKCNLSGNNFQYFPFGSGRRICAGLPLAERMLMYVLASLLHSFKWTLPKGVELGLEGKYGLVLKKLTPLVAIPTPRLSDLELYA